MRLSLSDIYVAGARLSHVRAEVCKALRAGAPADELQALLTAEAVACAELAALIESENGTST